MPSVGNGFITAIVGMLTGFLLSTIVSALVPAATSGTGNGIAVLFNLASIVVGIESLQRARYWGLMYSLGYFVGIALVGKYFMESWELVIYLVVMGSYMFVKISRKMGR